MNETSKISTERFSKWHDSYFRKYSLNPSTICDVNLNQLEEIVVFINKKMAVLKTMKLKGTKHGKQREMERIQDSKKNVSWKEFEAYIRTDMNRIFQVFWEER